MEIVSTDMVFKKIGLSKSYYAMQFLLLHTINCLLKLAYSGGNCVEVWSQEFSGKKNY